MQDYLFSLLVDAHLDILLQKFIICVIGLSILLVVRYVLTIEPYWPVFLPNLQKELYTSFDMG